MVVQAGLGFGGLFMCYGGIAVLWLNFSFYVTVITGMLISKKVREKSRECHNHKPQPSPDPKRKRKPTNLNKHKPNKRMKSTKISSLFPKQGNRILKGLKNTRKK